MDSNWIKVVIQALIIVLSALSGNQLPPVF